MSYLQRPAQLYKVFFQDYTQVVELAQARLYSQWTYAVSYTHLDVYKRQVLENHFCKDVILYTMSNVYSKVHLYYNAFNRRQLIYLADFVLRFKQLLYIQ